MFLLSPASCSGKRARTILRDEAGFPEAEALRSAAGLPLGEAFSFMSALYFRGKRAYAERFARPPAGQPGALVITSTRGLLALDTPVTADVIREFASVKVDPDEPAYREPLERSAGQLAGWLGSRGEAILLGSIATEKYLKPLVSKLGPRLLFPADFVGRGDMSRGGLLLRRARTGRELDYVVADGARRHGPRPPRLDPS